MRQAAHLPGGGGPTRRDFLRGAASMAAVGMGGCASWGLSPPELAEPSPRAGDLCDVNVTLSRWPLRRLPLDRAPRLVSKLRRFGVVQAWAGSFDGLLQRDLAAVNAQLAAQCRRQGPDWLVPFGSINPKLPDWEEELRRCAEDHRMPGIRLHPNYHGYPLDDADFVRLFRLAAERGLLVQIAFHMEDERMMRPLLRVEPVQSEPLARVVGETSGARVILLNALNLLRGEALERLLEAGEVFVEISMLEGVGGLDRLLERTPIERVLFGSHAPLFYFESSLLKLRESALDGEQVRALASVNARRLLNR